MKNVVECYKECSRNQRCSKTAWLKNDHLNESDSQLKLENLALCGRSWRNSKIDPLVGGWFFFSIWQCLTWLESEMDFSEKAVSDFELGKHCQVFQFSTLWLKITLYTFQYLKSDLIFEKNKALVFSETITKIWIFLISEKKYSQKKNYVWQRRMSFFLQKNGPISVDCLWNNYLPKFLL